MSESTYDLVFRGELLPDTDADAAREQLGRALKLEGARLDQLFSGANVVLRRGVDRDTAVRFQAAFKQAGARLRVQAAVAEPPAAVASTPASAPARKQSLAERLAAQAAAEADAEAAAGAAAEAAAEAAAAQQAAAGGVNPSARFSLAPVGADLIRPGEKPVRAGVVVRTDHLDLAPQSGNLPRLPAAHVGTPVVQAPDLEVAEVGTVLGELTDFVELPLDLSAFSLAPPGAQLVEPKATLTRSLDLAHLSIAPVGTRLSSESRSPP